MYTFKGATVKSGSKPYHHGDLKTELIQATLKAIENRGQVEFNLREIAKDCGVSVAAVYRHFASKNQLLIELAGLGFAELAQTYQAIMSKTETANPERLQALGKAYVLFAIENEGLFRVMFCRELCKLPEFEQIAEISEQSLTRLQEALTEKKADNSCTTGLTAPVLAAWARVHGLAFLWLDQNTGLNKTQFLQQVDAILACPEKTA